MRITEDVRKDAAKRGVTEEAASQQGLEQKATEFNEASAEIYVTKRASEVAKIVSSK